MLGVNNAASFGNTPHGNQYLVLGPLSVGGNSVSQTITGFLGTPAIPAVYDLHFSQSSGISTSILDIIMEGDVFSPGADNFAVGPATGAEPFDTWDDLVLGVVSIGPTIKFTFLDFGSLSFPPINDVGLDDIFLEGPGIGEVPEPGALAMFAGAAVSGTGLLLRRRLVR